ncbi:MAG: hypothetical protein J6328_02225 [Bacilli bacterium]|nr:hypothetical protein [Bacilli bacterium]
MSKNEVRSSYEYKERIKSLSFAVLFTVFIAIIGAFMVYASFQMPSSIKGPNALLLTFGCLLILPLLVPIFMLINLLRLKNKVAAEGELFTVTFTRSNDRVKFWRDGPEKSSFRIGFERNGQKLTAITSYIPSRDEFDHSIVEIAYLPSLERVWIMKKVKDLEFLDESGGEE